VGYPEPTVYAIPFFGVTLLLEPWLLDRQRRAGRTVMGYERRDRNASLGMGVGSLVFVTGINLAIFTLCKWAFSHRLWDLGTGALGWTVAMVGWDFAYYWHHRFEHRVRLLWACHVNHHSSRYYNLSTALRQPWTPFAGLVLYPPLALLGVAPWMIMVSAGLNLIYQYWIHTEAIDRMPGWFEAVLNTPSHHRVHHGSNPQYIDKNYGGILIVWDRLLGTFEPEREAVTYGLTKNIATYDLLAIAFGEYGAVARDAARARGWVDKLGVLLRGPEWRAPSLRQ
jgi:sterol desaturase/sphingolipid hydroxylase (fatty acid hydroxylase superfamily)